MYLFPKGPVTSTEPLLYSRAYGFDYAITTPTLSLYQFVLSKFIVCEFSELLFGNCVVFSEVLTL